MRIEWREVTWYSRLAAAIFFVALPFVGFWLGIRYARMVGPLTLRVEETPVNEESPNGPSQSVSSFGERPKSVLAKNVLAIPLPQEFTFKTLPGVSFNVLEVGRISGGVAVPACGTGSFFYLPDPADPRALGSCVNVAKLALPGETPGLVYVTLEIANQSNTFVNGRFLQLFWNPERGDALDSSLGQITPPRDAYGVLPKRTQRTIIGFLVPAGQEQVQLVFGEYGKAPSHAENSEDLLGKSVGGWIVNFREKSIVEISG